MRCPYLPLLIVSVAAAQTAPAGLAEAPLRPLYRDEIVQLEQLGNNCSDWSQVHVADGFDCRKIRQSTFAGTVLLGRFTGQARLADSLEPVYAPISSNPELEREYQQWDQSRSAFNAALAVENPEEVRRGWQRDYMKGLTPLGERAHEHGNVVTAAPAVDHMLEQESLALAFRQSSKLQANERVKLSVLVDRRRDADELFSLIQSRDVAA